MSSRRLTNNGPRSGLSTAALAAAAVFAVALSSGCGKGGGAEKGTAAAPPRPASVRIEALLPAHPLWPEVGRIDAMLARLGGGTRPATGGGAPESGDYVLPALDARPGDGAERIRAQRAAEQDALRREADANLAAFLESLEYRNSLREAQRRDELEAILRVEVADRLRTGRAEIDAATAAAVAATGDRYANLVIKRDALKNDLRTPPLLRSLTDAEQLKQEVAKVDAAKRSAGQPLGASNRVDPVPTRERAPLLGAMERPDSLVRAESPPGALTNPDGTPLVVSDRARLTSDLQEVEAARTELLAEVRRREQEGRERIARLAAELEQEKDRDIERILASERDDDREENLVEELRQRREDDVALEAQAARGTGGGAAGSGGGRLGAVRVAAALPVSVSGGGNAAASARARLLRERQRLEAILRADVADAVRDAAEGRDLAVTFVETMGAKNDMTEQFRVWVRPALPGAAGAGGGPIR